MPVSGPAPAFGDANDYVLRDLLGMSAAEAESLREQLVVTDVPLG